MVMKRYSKPLGNLFSFKQDFFCENDNKPREFEKIALTYRQQPRRLNCKNCDGPIDFTETSTFTKLGVQYSFCVRCGHLNGAHEDTNAYCSELYEDKAGENYASTYLATSQSAYQERVDEIYVPKTRFLLDALASLGEEPGRLIDIGAGAGHFVSAAKSTGFTDSIGYEPSKTLVDFGNAMIGQQSIIQHELSDLISIVRRVEAQVVSMIFVLEHTQSPRSVMQALSENEQIKFVYFSVPLFSPTVLFESVFPEVMPRHLVAGHTHLYTEQSIRYLCNEFGFTPMAEWWFGLDIGDLYRSLWVSLGKAGTPNAPLREYLTNEFLPLVDRLQHVLDSAHQCTEVHMLLKRGAS
jgi:hypothetical protein